MADYAESSLYEDDDLCRHGKLICAICASEEGIDPEETEVDDDE